MINEQFARTELLFGTDGMAKLQKARVAVFGIGGVGGYVVEALARSGVGTLDLIDNDRVSMTNLNRQIIATHKTIGQYKVDAAEERIREICPYTRVIKHQCFFLPDNADAFDFTQYDYVVDAIDTVSGKLAIITKAKDASVPVISSMGAGNKLDPTAFKVTDISKTKVDPLARVMRYELKKRGISGVKVVYSEEMPRQISAEAMESVLASERGGRPHVDGGPEAENNGGGKRTIPGSNAFVPSVAGLIIAGEVLKDLCGITNE
ncbi:MAG: tRNA threonylcarbamoyladenosine dehydratase [Lachnospiraceae bacterium]|nr:tRNA threonylcarbamoyladenosine dehydratase [Lachnospiraceae bacterium]